ncbi:MAG TPA: hypothetical protein DCY20_02830 [Firmicutes bacterium]|nr:hypothetical protein [Bacillota bacterium]
MKQREELLDFIKGLAIISVILIHNLKDPVLEDAYYWYYIGQAVPLFMLVSGYLGYKKYTQSNQLLVSQRVFLKTLKSIFIPFVFITVLQLIGRLYLGTFNFESFIELGGMGPGSYYPWIFIQAIIIMPAIVYLSDRYAKTWQSASIIVGISILLNVILTILDIPKDLYRLLVVRYIVYLYLGCLWRKNGLRWSFTWVILIGLSALFAWLQIYEHVNFTPLIFNSWRTYSWLTACYTVGLVLFIKFLYRLLKPYNVTSMICFLGTHSYYIFLSQLLLFSLFKRSYLDFITIPVIKDMAYVLLTLMLSLAPLYVNWLRKKREDLA